MNEQISVTEKHSLYQRLGGEPGLRELVDDIVDRIAANPFLEYYFRTIDMGRIKLLAFDYFNMKTGGPQNYTGPDLHKTFYAMNVRPEEYQYALDEALFIMNEKGIDQPQKNEVLAILEELSTVILRNKTF